MTDSERKFDFDAWTDLARRDPQAYFRQRERAILDFIERHVDSRETLFELQAHIDAMRAVAGSPQQALRGIVGMLEDRLEALALRLEALREETEALRELMRKRSR